MLFRRLTLSNLSGIKSLLSAKNASQLLLDKKTFISQSATAVQGEVIVPEYRLTILPSGFRVASENLEMPTATVCIVIT
jgi:hypothetical protein